MATNKLTHEMFLERVNNLYGDSIEVLSEYKGTLYDIDFIYKCKHGEQRLTTKAGNLISRGVKRCYCDDCRYPNREKIYIGATFGDWTVVELGKGYKKCKCRCKCTTEKMVDCYSLITGTSSGCGCIRKTEEYVNRLKAINKKYNDFVIRDDYVIMYTSKNEPFFVDIQDFGKVKNICWCKNNSGYLTGNAGNGQTVMLHRYIMDCPDDMDVDHKHGCNSKHDNRRSNLRIGTAGLNQANKPTISTNTSGVTGVYWSNQRNKWIAQISCGVNEKTGKKKCHYLGCFDNKEDAIVARKAGEEKYFGEWSYDNSQNS